jgi:hypothetical protein
MIDGDKIKTHFSKNIILMFYVIKVIEAKQNTRKTWPICLSVFSQHYNI